MSFNSKGSRQSQIDRRFIIEGNYFHRMLKNSMKIKKKRREGIEGSL